MNLNVQLYYKIDQNQFFGSEKLHLHSVFWQIAMNLNSHFILYLNQWWIWVLLFLQVRIWSGWGLREGWQSCSYYNEQVRLLSTVDVGELLGLLQFFGTIGLLGRRKLEKLPMYVPRTCFLRNPSHSPPTFWLNVKSSSHTPAIENSSRDNFPAKLFHTFFFFSVDLL